MTLVCVSSAALSQINGDLSDGKAPGIDNLLYSADAEFSCFAVSITSQSEAYKLRPPSYLRLEPPAPTLTLLLT